MRSDPGAAHCEGHALKAFFSFLNRNLYRALKKRVSRQILLGFLVSSHVRGVGRDLTRVPEHMNPSHKINRFATTSLLFIMFSTSTGRTNLE